MVKEEVIRRDLQTSFHVLGRHDASEMPDFFSQADAMLVNAKEGPNLCSYGARKDSIIYGNCKTSHSGS